MDEADRALVAMGYNPVFKREFSKWSCFSFALSVSGLYATIMATFIYPLYAGGAAAVVWCWLIGGGGALALALSIAEISSAYPTSGAMYFTLKYLCPQAYLPVVAWLDGWLNLIGTITGTASSQYGAAQMLLSAVSIGTGFDYQPTQGHITGVMAALCVVHAMVNSLSTAWLNKISSTYAFVHIGVLIAAAVALLALQKDKHDAEYVFTDFEPLSGWSPPSFSFFFGCLSAAWIMTNCDGVGHIAEETKDPSRVVPMAIAAASIFTYVAGFAYNIVLAYTMGDPRELVASPTGLPVAQILYNVMGPGPAVLFIIAGFFVMNFVCIPSVHAGSRTLWAFSRDEMIPLSRYWYRIHKRTETPLHAVWLYAALCILINLIGLGSPILIAAVFNTCAIALNWSYCIPILCKLVYGKFERGPWNLGQFSLPLNVWAVLWNGFLSVLFLFPTLRPVTPENMNYSSAVLAVVILFSVAHWLLGGRKIEILHPDYLPGENTLLVFRALDDGGIEYDTALVACGIIAGNIWSGFFATRDTSGALVSVTRPVDGILRGDSYFFQLPDADAPERPYPVIVRFSDWCFPHRNLPRPWKDLEPETDDGGASCRVTDAAWSVEKAHLVPLSAQPWWIREGMERYTITDRFSQADIDANDNLVALRSDMHKLEKGPRSIHLKGCVRRL
ncbi:hypothetical protein VTK26DRAFT_6505 [Humicola hyalothermophila]